MSAQFSTSLKTEEVCLDIDTTDSFNEPKNSPINAKAQTLGSLHLGARLIFRSRKDWRAATVVHASSEKVTLAVCAPSGYIYRVRRPPDAPLYFDGAFFLLDASAAWRANFARYDSRW